MDTTHPSCRDYQQDHVEWAKQGDLVRMVDGFDFVRLHILREEEDEDNNNINTKKREAIIEFQVTVRVKDDDNSNGRRQRNGGMTANNINIAGKEMTVTETARFIQEHDDGIWMYAGGDIRPQVAGLEDTILNV